MLKFLIIVLLYSCSLIHYFKEIEFEIEREYMNTTNQSPVFNKDIITEIDRMKKIWEFNINGSSPTVNNGTGKEGHWELTKAIIKKLEIMKFNNINYYNFDGEWFNFLSTEELDGMIYEKFPNLTFNEIKNECKKIATILSSKRLDVNVVLPEKIILFKNGFVDLELGSTHWFTPYTKEERQILPIKYISIDYKETNMTANANKFINWCGNQNEEEANDILKFLGITMTNTQVEFFFNLYGVGGSGKSSLLTLARQLVGFRHTVEVPINTLGQRFSMIPLINKRMLFNGDASQKEIDPAALKLLTTKGHTFHIEIKGQNKEYAVKLPLSVVILSNKKLNFVEFTGAEKRRFVPLEFPNVSKGNENALNFEEWRSFNNYSCEDNGYNKEDIESMIYSILVQLQRFHKNNKQWKMSERSCNALQSIEEENNNVLRWYEEYDWEGEVYDMNTTKRNWFKNPSFYYIKGIDLYQIYQNDTANAGGRAKGKNNFFTELIEILKHKGVKGKSNHFVNGVGKGFFVIYNKEKKNE